MSVTARIVVLVSVMDDADDAQTEVIYEEAGTVQCVDRAEALGQIGASLDEARARCESTGASHG